MSGKRAVTGTMFGFFLFLGIGIGLVWSVPYILQSLFPGYIVSPTEPWLLTVNDLTWQRSVIILFSKQGFKLLALGGWVILWIVSRWLRADTSGTRRLTKVWLRTSIEWAVEGRRSSPLLEYVRWITG